MSNQMFVDYYEVLQVSPHADLDTIERVYRLLAKKFHPDNRSTGNVEKFEILTTAYKTVADPEKRAAYDVNYDQGKSHQWKAISKGLTSNGFETDQHIRRTILSILYTHKRQNPLDGGVGVVQLEMLMQWPGETLDFHIWYLKEKALIARTETGTFEITAHGVDQIETDGLVLQSDRLLTESTDPSEDKDTVKLIESETI